MKKSNLKKIISMMSCLSFANSLSNLSLHAMNNESALNMINSFVNVKKNEKWETDEQSFKTKDEWVAYYEGYMGNKEELAKYQKGGWWSKPKKENEKAWKLGSMAFGLGKQYANFPERVFSENEKREWEQKLAIQFTGAPKNNNHVREEIKEKQKQKEKENSAPLDVQKKIQIKRIINGVENGVENEKDNLKYDKSLDKKQIEEKNKSKDFKTKNNNHLAKKTEQDNSINLQTNKEKSQNKGLIKDGNPNKIINKDINKVNGNPENILEKSNGMNKAIVKIGDNSSKASEIKNSNNIVKKVIISQKNENINEDVLQNEDKQLNEKEKSLDELSKELEKEVGIKADANKDNIEIELNRNEEKKEEKKEELAKPIGEQVKKKLSELQKASKENNIHANLTANLQKEFNEIKKNNIKDKPLHEQIEYQKKVAQAEMDNLANKKDGNNLYKVTHAVDEKGNKIKSQEYKEVNKINANANRPGNINTNIEDGKIGKKSKLNGNMLDKIKEHPYLSGTVALAIALGAYKGLNYYMESDLEDKKAETAKQNAKLEKMHVMSRMADMLNKED